MPSTFEPYVQLVDARPRVMGVSTPGFYAWR
jgi:hypothetical protein